MDAATTVGVRPWGRFGAWLLVGAAWSLGVVAILSIGLFVLPVAAVATVLLARRAPGRPGLPGLVSGLGAPVLYVAYLNRSGPGNVCTATARASSCVQEFDPWSWLIVGLVLVTTGIAVFWLRTRPRPRV